MKRLKIFATIFIAILLVFIFKNISYGVGESQLKINRSYIENNPNRYCGDHDGGFPKPGESRYKGDITYNLSAHVRIDGSVATNLTTGASTDAGNPNQGAVNRTMYKILSGEYTGSTGYGRLNHNTDTQLVFWGFLNTWLNNVGGSLGLDPRLQAGMDRVSKLYKDAGLGSLYNQIMNAGINGSGGVVDIYIYIAGNGTTSYQKVYEVVLGETTEAGLTINKVDADTGAFLANVDFIIQKTTGEYILPDGSTTTDRNTAMGNPHTTTGGPYNINVPEGDYVVTEIANRNAGYESAVMQKASATVSASNPGLAVITMKNAKDKEPDAPPPEAGEGEGTVSIEGYVWEDDFNGKGNSSDNMYGAGDQPLSGIRVIWYTSGGEYIKETKTDGSGYYKMTYISEYGNIIKDPTKPVEYNKSVLDKLTNSYVVFEYNGVKYTTVANNTTEEKGSRGKESEADRVKVDSLFGDITKDTVQPTGDPLNIQKNTLGDYELQDDDRYNVSASTKGVISNLLGTIEEDKNVNGRYKMTSAGAYRYGPGYVNGALGDYAEAGSYYTQWCFDYGNYWKGTGAKGDDWTEDTDRHKIGQVNYKKWVPVDWEDDNGNGNMEDDEIIEPAHWEYDHSDIYCDDVNAWKDPESLVPNDWTYVDVTWSDDYKERDANNGDHSIGEKKEIATHLHIKNVNLGLVRRESPDLALKSDINNVIVTMKGQQYTYYYGKRGIQNISAPQVSFSDDGLVYTRPINPSDIAYINDNNTNDMTIQVQYDIRVYNQSTTLQTIPSEIVDYYDSRYELISTGWTSSSKYGNSYSGNGYMAAYSSALSGTVLKPGESAGTSIIFKVNDQTVKALIGGEQQLFNVSEINVYSVLYGESTRCAEATTAASRGKTGTQYAGIDVDSIPGTAVPGNIGTYEDDTDKAPILKLILDANKVVSGNVWEDTDVTSNNERLGNGTKDGNEKGVENVKVELLSAETGQVVKLYPTQGSTASVDAVVYTDSSGNYNFTGVVVDHYIIRYTYGNDNINGGASKINGHEINARNYKSTIITTDPIKSVMTGDNETLMWHLTQPDNASIARDNIDDRLTIPSLTYANYNDPHNISAYTPAFKIQVEYTEVQQAEVDANGGSFPHDWTIFDFGIIERPREDIVIDKTIENLKITLANGQVLTEGNPYEEKMNYVRALGQTKVFDRDTFQKTLGKEKALYIEMDIETIQGARLDILYAITVTNNSEIDYEYDPARGGNTNYYYYGQASSPLIKPSAELVVDYVDTELKCTTENSYNTNWTQITNVEADLFNRGYISNATLEAVKNGNYLVFITDVFKELAPGESHKENLFASKLLANQAEDYVYENHAEILQLNGKIARTIDSVANDSREQVRKTYKPGDYVPSLYRNELHTTGEFREEAGLHQQDDDMITIRITPPTGLSNNIVLYISVGAVALVVLSIGIIIIRKRVLGK